MKQKRNYQTVFPLLSNILYGWIAVMILISCAPEDVNSEYNAIKVDNVDVTLRIGVPNGNNSQTRSLTVTGESEVANLQVLVFNASDRFEYKARVASTSITNGAGNAYVRLHKSAMGEYYHLVLLANIDELTEPALGTTKADVLKQIVYSASIIDGVASSLDDGETRLPMWGESSEQIITDDTDFGELNLFRAVARLDVGVNFLSDVDGAIPSDNPTATGLENFHLKSVRVYNGLDKGYVAPVDGYGFISIPTDAALYTPSYLDYYINSLTNKTVGDIYLAEVTNHFVNVDSEGNTTTVNKDMEQRCCIVVGGQYNATPELVDATPITYYRIDFLTDGKTDESLTDIYRNNRYTFNIRSVYGPGYDTPEEAFQGKPVNISVNVAHWDQGLTHADYDGQDNFQCSSKNIFLDYASGSSVNISVQSNVPVDEWLFENQSDWNDMLTVTKPLEQTGYLTFTAKDYGPFSGEVRMKIHNLSVTFIVSQSNGIYLSSNGVLITDWNKPNSGDETDVPTKPDGITVEPNGGVTIGDLETDENSNFDGPDVRI